jgi:broad specificity phosphatase PhoE
MSVEIIYETHSTSVDNESGIATGWLPGKLSAAGRGQARELGHRHVDDEIAAIFISDLARAVETVAIAFADREIPVVQDARLRECNYGDLNGAPIAVVHGRRSGRIAEPFPGGESYEDVVERVADFLRDLARDWDGKHVLIVSHSAPRWALQCLLGGKELEDLVDAPFDWQPGWRFVLPSDFGK